MSFEKISGVTVAFLTNEQIRELREGKTVSANKFEEITNVSVQEDFVYIDLITPTYLDWIEAYITTIQYHTHKTIC